MSGKNYFEKMTETPLPGLVLGLAVPSVLSMLTTGIYNMADTAFVGKLGTSASGATGIVFGFMSIIQAIGFTFGQGSGSMLSRYLGARKEAEASVTASAGFFSSLLTGIIISVLSFIFLDPLVYILGSTETIAPFAKDYIFYIILVTPLMTCSFTMNNILRYEGKAAFGMAGLMTGSILNICGDAVFLFVLHMGIAGAGLSTALSQCISFVILLSAFLRGKTETKLSIRSFLRGFRKIPEIFATGLPSLLRQGLNSLSTILLNTAAGGYGDCAVAAMSITTRVIYFCYSFIIGIGQGYQPVSGFNYGARRYDRIRKGFIFTLTCSVCIALVFSVISIAFPVPILRIFQDDPDVISIGIRALRLQAASQIVLPLCSVTELQMQSTGQKIAASVLSSLRSGIFFIPVLLLLTHLRGISGLQEAQAVSNVLSIIPSLFCARWFFMGKLRSLEKGSGQGEG